MKRPVGSTRDEILDERVKLYDRDRIARYSAAMDSQPKAREMERRPLIELLELEPGVTVCDTMAGEGFLARGIWEELRGDCAVYCVEPSLEFAKSIGDPFRSSCCAMSAMSFPDASFDRVCTLAGTHHLADKRAFFAEANRVLKSGGRFAVADVLEGSPPAIFLDTTVDELSDIGHEAIFWRAGEMEEMLKSCGFVSTREVVERYTWDFPDLDSLVAFCTSLFRLTKANPFRVESELRKHLEIRHSSNGCQLEWMLVYACGAKR